MLNKLFKKIKPDKATGKGQLEPIYNLIRNLLDEEEKSMPLTPDTVLEEIGFDSIKYIHLLLSLEDLADGNIADIISDMDISSVRTIGDIAELVQRLDK